MISGVESHQGDESGESVRPRNVWFGSTSAAGVDSGLLGVEAKRARRGDEQGQTQEVAFRERLRERVEEIEKLFADTEARLGPYSVSLRAMLRVEVDETIAAAERDLRAGAP